MRRAFITSLALLLIGCTLWAQEGKVRVTGVVQGADKAPLSGVMVSARAEGTAPVETLTDGSGRFSLLLLPGQWSISASRLGGGEIARQELRVRPDSPLELTLVAKPAGDPGQADEAGQNAGDEMPAWFTDSLFGEEGNQIEVSSEKLGSDGRKAVVELSMLTDSVFQQAWQRIVEDLAAKRFDASFWLDVSDRIPQDQERLRGESFRLDIDTDKMGSTGLANRSLVNSLLEDNSPMVGVPVKVNIGLSYGQISDISERLESGLNSNAGDAAGFRAIPDTNGSRYPSYPLDASRETRYSASGDSATVKGINFRAVYDFVSSRLNRLYRPLREAYVTEIPIRQRLVESGIEFGVQKTFLDGLRGTVKYYYSEAGGLDIRRVDLFFESIDDFERFLERGLRHDLSTTIEAAFRDTGTSVKAVYRLYLTDIEQDSGFDDSMQQLREHSRLDVSFSQRIDFGLLSNARVSLNLAIQNLLNKRRNTIFLDDDDLLMRGSRTLIGGIRIEF